MAGTVKLHTPQCIYCGSSSEITVDKDGFDRWRNGTLVQNAFPNMNADDRELLVTGTHPVCWDKIFQGDPGL